MRSSYRKNLAKAPGYRLAAGWHWPGGNATVAQGGPATAEINWFSLSMGLLGGLAMFLFGLDQLSEGLKSVAGDSLKDLLAKLTKNRFTGAISGAFITALLNSSSVTT